MMVVSTRQLHTHQNAQKGRVFFLPRGSESLGAAPQAPSCHRLLAVAPPTRSAAGRAPPPAVSGRRRRFRRVAGTRLSSSPCRGCRRATRNAPADNASPFCVYSLGPLLSRACLGKKFSFLVQERCKKGVFCTGKDRVVLFGLAVPFSVSKRPAYTKLRKTPLFSQLFLCLSRACVGKKMHYMYKWHKKWRFSYLVSQAFFQPAVSVPSLSWQTPVLFSSIRQ